MATPQDQVTPEVQAAFATANAATNQASEAERANRIAVSVKKQSQLDRFAKHIGVCDGKNRVILRK